MRRAILLALAGLALAAGPAQAADSGGGTYANGHWAYPGQRVASNPSVTRWQGVTEAAWRGRGLRPCARPTIYLADYLGREGRRLVLGRADRTKCEMWLLTALVRETQRGSLYDRLEGEARLCVYMQHEEGHLAGLGHSERGIMAPTPSSGDSLRFVWSSTGQVRARAQGLCSSIVAAEYNRAHPLNAGKRLDGRFDLR